jgi:hypothetical protein
VKNCPKLPLKNELIFNDKEVLTEVEIKAANQKNIADLAKRVRDLYEEGVYLIHQKLLLDQALRHPIGRCVLV